MRICFCIAQLNSGGAERVVANLANAFTERKNNVAILLISVTKPTSFYELHKSVKVDVLSKNKVCKGFKKIRLMRAYFKNNRFDVVISFLPNPIIYSYFSLRKLNSKLICSERSNPKKYGILKRVTLRHIFKNCSGTVFQTTKAQKYYNRDDGIVIYNPIINIPKYYNTHHEKCVSFVGSFRKVKNFDLLFKSFKDFCFTHNDYRLNIYGVDANNRKCIHKIKRYNISNKVCLKGKISNIQEELLKSSLYVSTSLYEGMSNSVLEAASLGIPCVVTNCDIGGNFEISKFYPNVYLSDFNFRLFSQTMSKALNQYTAPKIKDVFSLNYISDKWLNYIIYICNKKD